MIFKNKTNTLVFYFLLATCAFSCGLLTYRYITWDFKTLDEKKYKHSDLQGSVVVVNYFAEWCAPCLREIPELNEFYHQMPENVKLFAISFDEVSTEKLREIQLKYNIEFDLVADVATPFSFNKPQYLPATFIIKPNGELAGQLLGEQTVKSLNEAISSL